MLSVHSVSCGSLVSASIAQPLTTVSEIGDMYVYFSMTEKGAGIDESRWYLERAILEKMPAVRLQ